MALKNRKQLGSTLNNAAGGSSLQRVATIAANGDMMQSLQGVILTQAEPAVSGVASEELAASQAATGIVTSIPTGGTITKTTDAVANWITEFGLVDDNDSRDFIFINLSVDPADYIVFAGAAGVTFVGDLNLVPVATGGASATFRVRKTGAATVTTYRIA
jgi:hypothetical protein